MDIWVIHVDSLKYDNKEEKSCTQSHDLVVDEVGENHKVLGSKS